MSWTTSSYLLLQFEPLDGSKQLGPVVGVQEGLDDGPGPAAELGVGLAPDANHGDVRDGDLAVVRLAAAAGVGVDGLQQPLHLPGPHPRVAAELGHGPA